VPFSFTQTAPGPFGLVLALLLSVLFLFLSVLFLFRLVFFLEGAEPAACRYAEAAARLLPAPLLTRLDWASLPRLG
jgi:hypothetical protein